MLALAALVAGVFWIHLSGRGLFVGDSDRLNTLLNMRLFQVEGLRQGRFWAWDESTFMGVSIYGLHYIVPDAVAFVEMLFPPSTLFVVAGFVACCLMTLAAGSAYVFIRDTCGDPFSAFVGAALYVFSAYSVLRVAQLDGSVMVLVHIPIGLLILRRIRPGFVVLPFLLLTLLLVSMWVFTYLQEVAYVMVLFAAYAIHRSVQQRSWYPATIFSAAFGVAMVACFPRLYTILEDLRQFSRAAVPWYPNGREVLRLLDDGIFGRYLGEARAFGNLINLHEGLLLYTSTFSVLLILKGLARFRGRWLSLLRFLEGDSSFFAWFSLGILAALLTHRGQKLIDIAFGHAHLLHARLSIVVLLPLCTLVSVLLHDLRAGAEARLARHSRIILGGAAIAAATVWFLDASSRRFRALGLGPRHPIEIGDHMFLVPREVDRVVMAAAIFLIMLAAMEICRDRPVARLGLVYTLGFVMVCQSFSYAWFMINGNYAWSYPIPFKQNNFLMVRPDQLRLPGRQALEAFKRRLETPDYRTALICDPALFAVFCSPHLAEFWRLRLVDGYVPGVPARLAQLPWPEGVVTLRAISFPSRESLPWPLLALLNVKYAMVVNESVYFNRAPAGVSDRRDARPEDSAILVNPWPVVPRQFFVEWVRPVAGPSEATAALDAAKEVARPILKQSFAEGFGSEVRRFATSGRVAARYDHDEIHVDVDPSDEARFLVFNELYHPRWHAWAANRELHIYPTNVVMRGVLVPPEVSRIELRFVPFVRTPLAGLFFVAGAALLVGVAMILRRVEGRL